LLAKGLVQTDDGKVVGVGAGSRSLLALSLRARMIGPDRLAPFTRPLQVLLWPPVFGIIVVLSLVGLGWLFLVHGVGAGARSLLYAPALMVVALAVTALGAAFHELGHAAALTYGGGQPKGMGVGLYLVYPAFYTDVSDNYRLTRWARVRTDLAGVLFHFVFMLGLLGVFALTGWEPILIFALLVLLDALHQLLPLVRLDGYWTLADVTGVPDFYSYMGAFVRRFLPGQQEGASRLPKLKWWGTLVFAGYMLFAVPLMLFSIFAMLKATPSLLATGWDSAGKQYGALQQAAGGGDLLAMVVAAIQLVVLVLPTAALIYSLVRFGRRIGTGVWNWSKPTPLRRVIGGLGTVAACGLLVYLWAPQLPFGGHAGLLYGPTAARFRPIQPETRGTLFDAVGAPQPDWTANLDPKASLLTPLASPGPLDGLTSGPGAASSPTPALGTESAPQATTGPLETPGATPIPDRRPTVAAPTLVSAPAVVPPAAATVGASTSVSAPVPVATAVSAPVPGVSNGAAPTQAPAAPAPAVSAPTSRAIPATWTPRPAQSTPPASGSPAPR
jgi:putative peptide zinc metalloprotease protein